MPSAEAIKVRNRKYYKGNAENIRSPSRDNYQNNPQIKSIPRERATTMTLTINKAKEADRKQYSTNPEPKKRTARKQYSVIQSPKREPLVSNIILNQPGRNKAAARVRLDLNRDNMCSKTS